ncbi:hypothetical protein PV08_01440 [Exophiala spinifera]|uniref:Uncharacterized protein n=1 Tax=Exophiala spinifera TaxID=91928 RepID=A0A0D2A7U7_9EURO|nr:uncharacterized protein PV08_01440 [Exophiala spinifera]KIW20862.1 hypothetical protein PV08_01440 [Exophiala spinifera]
MTTVKPFCSNNAQGTNHPVIASSPFKRPAPLRASTSRTSRLPSIQEECPPYDSLRSTPSSEQREEFLDNQFSWSYTEESLEGETRHNSDDEELPPYVLLDNGANKPAYSRRQSEATSSTTSVVHQQQPYQSTKLDGILCPRCNLRRAKAWYRQIQKDREPGEESLVSVMADDVNTEQVQSKEQSEVEVEVETETKTKTKLSKANTLYASRPG